VLFPSLINWLAFLLITVIYWLLPPPRRLAWLAVTSLALLAFNDFLAALLVLYLLLLCALAQRALGLGHPRWRRILLLGACLAPLVLLKYQALLGLDALQNAGALPLDFSALAVPLGISYLTFKCLMFIVAAARASQPPCSLTALAAYLAFAPAASSGPIDPPQRLLKQLLSPARFDLDRLLYALYRIAMGVIFKFVLADTLAEVADSFSYGALAVSSTRLLAFGPYYGLKLYFDFAGYSHIAIGAGYLLGVKCMENFAAPLLKPNISEFWRSWHISLTSFLRSHIFQPCAYRWARRLGPQRAAYAATFIAFLACGAWHGDGLNYLLWGAWHGLLLVLHQAFLRATRKRPLFRALRRQRWLALPAWALTFALVSLGWLLFAFTLEQLAYIFSHGAVQ